jgi:hypothetical protein
MQWEERSQTEIERLLFRYEYRFSLWIILSLRKLV